MGNDTALSSVSGIGVLDKTVAVLRALSEGPGTLGDICDRTGLPRATAHRLAVGLVAHGLLTRDASGAFLPGPTLTELAAGAFDPLREAAASVLPRLRAITGESVQVFRRDGHERLCIAADEPPSGLRDTVPVGARLPMTAGSAAKVLLAWADHDAKASVLAESDIITERVLIEVRRQGWAYSHGEREPGVASVSAPVRDGAGDVVASISVSGPIERLGRKPAGRWAADLLTAADAISHRL